MRLSVPFSPFFRISSSIYCTLFLFFVQNSFAQIPDISQLPIQVPALMQANLPNLGGARLQTATDNTDIRRQQIENPETKAKNDSIRKGQEKLLKADLEKEAFRKKIFGYSIFRDNNDPFSQSLKIATPKNYILGTDDEVVVDVSGMNAVSRRLTVSPDGYLRWGESIGNIYVAGKPIEQAKNLIRERLASIYGGLSSGNSFLNVSLGNIKTIQVSVLGEVTKPGTFPVSSFARITNALYQAGGINEIGSFRKVQVVRGDKIVATLDLYEILTTGASASDINLRDQDAIIVQPYKVRVSIDGKVKRPGFFEVLPTEKLQQAIGYAGGFENDAFATKLRVSRNTDREVKILDVNKDQYEAFELSNGDKIEIGKILDRFENRVKISGAVYREGAYSLESNPSVLALVKNAELKEDAFTGRVNIIRLLPDLSLQNVSVNLASIINGKETDVALQREDEIVIKSKNDLRENRFVRILGAVNQEAKENETGFYPYIEGETIEDLVIRAGGLKYSASISRVDLYRLKVPSDQDDPNNIEQYEYYKFSINRDLTMEQSAQKFVLKPFDRVFVRTSPNHDKNASVLLEGEVVYGGEQMLVNRAQRISDVIKMAGGLSVEAYPKGATLLRKVELSQAEIDKRNADIAAQNDNEQKQVGVKDELNVKAIETNILEPIDINLEEAISKPGSESDLILQDGDIIRIPKLLQTVRIMGEVLSPTTTRYKGGSFMEYISSAGGFTSVSRSNGSFVRYANGKVERTKKVLFFRSYPHIEPGAEIIVPTRRKEDVTFQQVARDIGAITGIIAGLGNLVLLYYLVKN